MGECNIQEGPFSLEFDGVGGVCLKPQGSAYYCWWENRNGRLHRCCYTSTGIICYPMFYMEEIRTEAPPDPGPPAESR